MARKPNRNQRYLDHPGDRYRYSKPIKSTHGTYMVRIYDRATGGRVKTVSTRSRAYATAERFRDELRIEWENKNDEPKTFGDVAEAWLQEKKQTVRPATYVDYSNLKKLFVEELGSETLLEEITTGDIRRAVNKGNRSPCRKRNRKNAVHSVFEFARENKWLKGENPAHGIKTPATTQKSKVLLTQGEASLLLALAEKRAQNHCVENEQGERITKLGRFYPPPAGTRLAFCLALQQGLRQRTILQMTWENVSFDQKLFSFESQQMKRARPFKQPLHRDTEFLLKEELQRQGKIEPKGRVLQSLPRDSSKFRQIFYYVRGRLITHINDQFRKDEIKTLTFHGLRDFYASTVARHSSVPVLQALLHHNSKIALGISGVYAQATWDELVRAQNRVPSLLETSYAKFTSKTGV